MQTKEVKYNLAVLATLCKTYSPNIKYSEVLINNRLSQDGEIAVDNLQKNTAK